MKVAVWCCPGTVCASCCTCLRSNLWVVVEWSGEAGDNMQRNILESDSQSCEQDKYTHLREPRFTKAFRAPLSCNLLWQQQNISAVGAFRESRQNFSAENFSEVAVPWVWNGKCMFQMRECHWMKMVVSQNCNSSLGSSALSFFRRLSKKSAFKMPNPSNTDKRDRTAPAPVSYCMWWHVGL